MPAGSRALGAGLEAVLTLTKARLLGARFDEDVLWIGVETHAFHLFSRSLSWSALQGQEKPRQALSFDLHDHSDGL